MKTLGTIMIVVGCFLCLTWILMIPGLMAIGVGALLRIAGKKSAGAVS